MRKKFIRVAVFCALTATAAPVFVGCSDYDDDINRLQGEIDQINGVIGVSGEEMAAAIQTAIDGLQAELDQAIAGKADDAAVQQLQATVQQLVDAMESEDGSIDANLIQQLTGEIEALKVEVNNTKGNLDEQKETLEGKINSVEEKIGTLEEQIAASDNSQKIAALETEVGDLTRELATLKTNLDKVMAALDDNGQLIANLAGRLESLENFKEAVENEEKPTYVEIAKFNALTNTVDSLSTELKTLKDKIDGATQGSEIGGVIERLEKLEAWKNDGINELLAGYATSEEVSTLTEEIEKIKAELGMITEGEEGDDVKTSLELIDEQIKTLESRVDKLFGNTLQSLVYLPNPDNAMGDTEFSTLWYRTTPTDANTGKKLTQNKQVKVRFRVTPAAAAKKIVETDNYTLTFDGMKQNYTTRTTQQAGLLNIVNKALGTDEGVVELTVEINENGYNNKTIGNNQFWALALNVKAKEPIKNEETGETPAKEDYTDIVSNYFITHREDITLAKVEVQHAPISDADLVYNDAADKVQYGGSGSWLAAWKYDESGRTMTPINFTGSYNKLYDFAEKFDCFTTTYKFQNGTDTDVFQIDGTTGVVTLKNPGSTAIIDKKAKVQANTTITFAGGSKTWESKFSRQVTVVRADLNATLAATDFVDAQGKAVDLSKLAWTKNAQTFYLNSDKLNDVIDLTKLNTGDFFDEIAAGSTTTWSSTNGKATLSFDATNDRIVLTIAAGAAIGAGESITATPEVTLAGATTPMKITMTIPATASYPEKVLAKAAPLWNEAQTQAIFKPAYTITEVTLDAGTDKERTVQQVQNVGFTHNIEDLFSNYTDAQHEIVTNRGGVLELTAKWPDAQHPNAVAVNGHDVTFSLTNYDHSYGAVKMTAKETYGGHAIQDLSGDIIVQDISGSWTQGRVSLEITDLRAAYSAWQGCIWKDVNGLVMWQDGSTQSDNYNGNGLTMNGLAAPTLEVVDDEYKSNADYINLNTATGQFTFTQAAQQLVLQQDLIIHLRVKADSRWGTISGYDANNIIEIRVKANK